MDLMKISKSMEISAKFKEYLQIKVNQSINSMKIKELCLLLPLLSDLHLLNNQTYSLIQLNIVQVNYSNLFTLRQCLVLAIYVFPAVNLINK